MIDWHDGEWWMTLSVKCVMLLWNPGHDHLLLHCPWINQLRTLLFRKMQVQVGCNLDEECKRIAKISKKCRGSIPARVIVMLWSEMVYETCLQRCKLSAA